jgi:hypothetical protein
VLPLMKLVLEQMLVRAEILERFAQLFDHLMD